ncbi:MAG: DUF2339 domain-containing protein, partial [Casimicrobiaceae bacterium]
MIALGIIIGGIVGALVLNWPGAIAGGFVGFIVAMAWRSRTQARERTAQRPPSQAANAATGRDVPDIARRLTTIERRLALLERRTGIAAPPVVPAPIRAEIPVPETPAGPTIAAGSTSRLSAAAPSRVVLELDLPDEVPVPASPLHAEPPPMAGFVRRADGTLTPAAVQGSAPQTPLSPPMTPVVPSAPNPIWAWFTGGNTLTRIGVIVLFLGVAFLLKYFADLITIPIEVKLLGVAFAGGALTLLGMRLAGKRPGYGLSLQGAGIGILYLTTFAAFRLYNVLPAVPAFVLLVAIAVLTVWLAVRADSQPLAGLAIAGGFLAPFLVATSAEAPARLFGYFAILNAAIFALAWVRAWRALNVLGFIFTFVLGLFWGDRFYRPEHFATVEPFLILFFLFYVTIAVLYARRGALEAKAPVDALLVFGVPLVAFALQAGLVYDTRYGVAWSAFGMSIVYAVLALALLRRPEPATLLLARAFVVLAVVFATVAIPFAVDPQWTTAFWALEAAGVYWIGCQQRQGLARAFALLLQLGAALAFATSGIERGDTLFLNAVFLGSTLIAVAALATAYLMDRHRDAIYGYERALAPWLMTWAVGWWFAGGALELARAMPDLVEGNAILAYAVGSVAGALLLRRLIRWPRLAWFGVALLPVMAIVALRDWDVMRTTLLA